MKQLIVCEILFAASLLGCGDNRLGPTPGPDGSVAVDASPPDAPPTEIERGKALFEGGTFAGNGTTCASCHRGTSGTLNPADVQMLLSQNPADPLFQHDRADTIGGTTFDRLSMHATILVDIPLPPNVSIVGSSERHVVLRRGIPTVMNSPAFDPVLMIDGRQSTLQAQAKDAIMGHSQGTPPSAADLDAIAAFEKTLFNRDNLRDNKANGTPLTMPLGTTPEELRGRRWFIADGETDPDKVGEDTTAVCGWCHSGPYLSAGSAFFGANITATPQPEGIRFMSVRVSETNTMLNPTYMWEIRDPTTGVVLRTASSPDPGVVLITGINAHFNAFKSTTLWGARFTAPYFHDNSAKNGVELMNHYADALKAMSTANPKVGRIIDMTAQEKADVLAYLKLL